MKENTRKGYTVNHFNRTITLTRNFSNKASIPGTEEYRIFLSLRRDNPEYEVIQRTIAKKEDKKKAPTYAQMLQYIACVENSDFYMARFEAMRAEAESKNGTYLRILRWFRATFPNFYAMPEFNTNNEVIVTTADYPTEDNPVDTNSVA